MNRCALRNAGRRRLHLLVLGFSSLALLIGCESAGLGDPNFSTSTTEATVKGKVFYKGQPITDGKVVFNPANAKRKYVPSHEAPVSKEGTYSVTTLVGTNSIVVDGPTTRKF